MFYNPPEPPVTDSGDVPCEPPSPAKGKAETKTPHACVPAADLGDVLTEQLEYLLAHGGCCRSGCPDCVRLERVKDYLLQPFSRHLHAA